MPETELAYKMMAWLNDWGRLYGGVFETKHGILDIWPGRDGWEYRYLNPKPLPEGVEDEESSGQ